MDRNKYSVDIWSWDFGVFVFFTLALGKGSSLFATFDPRINIPGFIILLICFVYLIKKIKHFHLPIAAKKVFIIISIWMLLQSILFGFLPVMIFLEVINIVGACLIVMYYNDRIIYYFERAMVVLSIAALFFWSIANTIGNSFLLALPHLDNPSGNSDYSLIVYAIFDAKDGLFDVLGIIRNSGFAWEPGLFSSFLVLGLYCNMIIHRGTKILNRNFIILLIALITTFSTTGYVAFIVLVILFLITLSKYNFSKKIIFILISIILISYIMTLPFMAEKIEYDMDLSNNAFFEDQDRLQWKETNESIQFTVGRFEGLYLDFLNIIDKPLLGYGFNRENSYIYNNISQMIITSNGIAKPIAKYGLLLALPFIVIFYRSTRHLEKTFDIKFPTLFIVLLSISFSYNIINSSLILALLLYSVFCPIKSKDN